jgi:outer membrane lipoprotein-sorting protein
MKRKLLIVISVLMIVACSEKNQEGEGGLEQMGKSMDQKLNNAKEYTGEKMKQMGNAMEQEGDDLENNK